MNHHNGFSLVEVLLALSISSFMLVIVSNCLYQQYESLQFQQFKRQLDQDLFYIQQVAITQTDNLYVSIDAYRNKYYIRRLPRGTTLYERQLPASWKIETSTLGYMVQFNELGNIRKPGSMIIRMLRKKYRVTCPFGKGRCYIERF